MHAHKRKMTNFLHRFLNKLDKTSSDTHVCYCLSFNSLTHFSRPHTSNEVRTVSSALTLLCSTFYQP